MIKLRAYSTIFNVIQKIINFSKNFGFNEEKHKTKRRDKPTESGRLWKLKYADIKIKARLESDSVSTWAQSRISVWLDELDQSQTLICLQLMKGLLADNTVCITDIDPKKQKTKSGMNLVLY